MKILIKGAGDLATGVAAAFWRKGHQVIMTEISRPLTVRRQVAFSRAVYEKTAVVEEIEAVLVQDYAEAKQATESKKVAVIVDPEANIRKEYHPDILVDAILAKRNTGTKKQDAPCVIGLGPGFCGGDDCDAVLETMRGETLGQIIYKGTPIPNTGVPGVVGGYSIERLLKAAADGEMKPCVKIGDVVEKGQILARTGGKPVYAGVSGIVRGMLQEGLKVRKGLKIGDVDPRKDPDLVYRISDKSALLGRQALKAAEEVLYGKIGIVVLAAGKSTRYGANKLLTNMNGKPMFRHIFEVLESFPMCTKVVSTRFSQIKEAAQDQQIHVAENVHPEWGISYSLQCGLTKCLEINPDVQAVLFVVGDQPYLKKETLKMLMEQSIREPEKIICAGRDGKPGNPVLWDKKYFRELFSLKGDTGGRQLIRKYPEEVYICETEKKQLRDIDWKEDMISGVKMMNQL